MKLNFGQWKLEGTKPRRKAKISSHGPNLSIKNEPKWSLAAFLQESSKQEGNVLELRLTWRMQRKRSAVELKRNTVGATYEGQLRGRETR